MSSDHRGADHPAPPGVFGGAAQPIYPTWPAPPATQAPSAQPGPAPASQPSAYPVTGGLAPTTYAAPTYETWPAPAPERILGQPVGQPADRRRAELVPAQPSSLVISEARTAPPARPRPAQQREWHGGGSLAPYLYVIGAIIGVILVAFLISQGASFLP